MWLNKKTLKVFVLSYKGGYLWVRGELIAHVSVVLRVGVQVGSYMWNVMNY